MRNMAMRQLLRWMGISLAVVGWTLYVSHTACRADVISDTKIVAHRGFSSIAPENTLASINAAIAIGAPTVEFDLYACASGEVVLMHDETVDRTTDGTGAVSSLTLAQLKQLDAGSWFSSTFEDERIPTLDETLAVLKKSKTVAACEIKESGIVGDVVSALTRADMIDQSVIISFNSIYLTWVHQLNPNIPTALNFSTLTGSTTAKKAEWISAQLTACDADIASIPYGLLSADLVASLDKVDVPVWAWTIDDTATMEKMFSWGADSITTNRPNLGITLIPEPSVLSLLTTGLLGSLLLRKKQTVISRSLVGFKEYLKVSSTRLACKRMQ